MSASAIGSITSSYLTQNINNVSTASYNAGTSKVAGAGGRHHHGDDGKFLQDVTQALQGIGLTVPGLSNNNVSSGSSAAGAATSSSASSVSGNAQQALQTFMYDLHQALSGQQQSYGATGGGANTNSRTQNPYGNFAANIQNVLGSLNNNASISGSNAIDSKLQTDFNNLVSVLGGSTASYSTSTPSTATTPSLQSFLQQLEANAGNTGANTTGVGAIFSAKV
jgi:hypothetical protein